MDGRKRIHGSALIASCSCQIQKEQPTTLLGLTTSPLRQVTKMKLIADSKLLGKAACNDP